MEKGHCSVVTLSQLLHHRGSFVSDILWELIETISNYLIGQMSCDSDTLFQISAEKLIFHHDGSLEMVKGTISEYGTSLYVAPEFYSHEGVMEPLSSSSIEKIHVYSLGMTIYSASEFNGVDEVELPEALEAVLMGMVQEVADCRITLTEILQECDRSSYQRDALSNLVKEYFIKTNEVKKAMLPPATFAPKPPSVHTLPKKSASSTSHQQQTPSSCGASSTGVPSDPASRDRGNMEHDAVDECEDVCPYATTELVTRKRNDSGDAMPPDSGYSNADDMHLADMSNNVSRNEVDKSGTTRGAQLPKDSPVPSSDSEIENPYGTLKPRCRVNDECSTGNCRHTPTELSLMYSTVQKSRSTAKSNKSSSGRPDGFRFDTAISSACSSENEQPIQLAMKNSGKPVIVQFPSNKRYQLPAQREDTLKSVHSAVITRLGIEDGSLFALQHCPPKGLREFVSPESRLKLLAPDKWKADTPSSPPVELKLVIKYFPPNPHMFVNQVTRLQFFMSIRNLILDGSYEISKEIAFDLAALSLQADVGDYYDQSSNNYFEPHSYIPPDVMSVVSYQYCTKEIPMLHSKLDDMSQNEAIIRYLQIVSSLPDYGIHFFEVSEKSPNEGEHSWIGVSLEAVLLFKKSSPVSRGKPSRRFEWQEIANISYKNKTFILDIVADERKHKSERRHAFETDSTKVSRQIMALCADTHKFYIKIKKMLPRADTVTNDPAFSVRDYTPSPKSVITNQGEADDGGVTGGEEGEEDTADTGIIRTKSVSRPETMHQTKRPPPTEKMIQKYVCLTKTQSNQSLGMTIVGGDGMQGIYVEQLAPRGLANLDGRIKPGDMLLSVNGTGLKDLTHKQAVELITQLSSRVELELVERVQSHHHNDIVPPETDSNNSIEVDYSGEEKKLNKSTSLPSVTSSAAPWFVRASKNAGRQPGAITPQGTLHSNNSRLLQYGEGGPIPESLQNRMNMQDRYNLVRHPQQSTTLPRGHSAPGNLPSDINLSKGEDSGVVRSAENFRANGGSNGDHVIINGKLEDGQLIRRLTRGSSEQIPPAGVAAKEEQSSCNGSYISDNSADRPYNKELQSHSSASFTNISESGKTEISQSSSKISSSRDPFSRIFSVYLTKQRSSLGMSVRVERGSVVVKDVVPHGPAAVSGMVERGDTILSVNGVDVSNMSHHEVVNVLQSAPTNVTLVMSWGTAPSPTKSFDNARIGMQFRVTLKRNEQGYGFTNRSTYMGHESFVRVKNVLDGGPAAAGGTLEEGDILLSAGGYSLENANDRILVNILASVTAPTEFIVYRPDTIRTFNPRKYEVGSILTVTSLSSDELLSFTLCQGYPYRREAVRDSFLLPNDRLLRIGTVCCQGIKAAQLQSITNGAESVDVQIFRPSIRTNGQSQSHLEGQLADISLSEPTISQLMEHAETITLEKKEQGLGFSLLGQQDGKRIVRGVTVKTVLEIGAAHEEGRLAPGDLIIMVNGQSMVGITQSKALRIIRKCTGQVVLTVVPGDKRNPAHISTTERKLIGLDE